MFHNCSCVEGQEHGHGNASAVLGQCQRESCTKAFPYFLALQTACAFILALGGTPTYMIMFRWNTLPYLDSTAWGKRKEIYHLIEKENTIWFLLWGMACCPHWDFVPFPNSCLRLIWYFGNGVGKPYAYISIPMTGMCLTEQWTQNQCGVKSCPRWLLFTLPQRKAFTFV